MPELVPGYHLIALDAVGSTNDEAKRRAARGAPDGTVVWARSQRAGRGRRARRWVSPPGNLYCSVLLRAGLAPAAAAQLSLVAALAAAEAVDGFGAGARCALKWPNDLLLNRRKVAGILLESSMTGGRRLDWIVLGLGVNLVSHPEIEAPFPASDLAAEGVCGVEPGALLAALLVRFDAWRRRWAQAGFAAVRAAWLARAEGLGGAVRVDLEGERVEGRFADLSARGEIVVALADGGRRRIAAGDLHFGDVG